MFSGLFTGFMANAWAEASIMAVVGGAVGFFVVMRGATFAAHAIPQGAFTGAAGAALVGANTLVGVGAFSLLGVLTIATWGRRGRHDVVTALSLVTLLGLGALFLSMSTEYSEQTFSLLFGEPLAVSVSEILPTAAIGAACLGLVVALYRRLVLSTVAPPNWRPLKAPGRNMSSYGSCWRSGPRPPWRCPWWVPCWCSAS